MNRPQYRTLLVCAALLAHAYFLLADAHGQERAPCLAKFTIAAPGGRLLAIATVGGCSFLMEADSGAVCTFFDRRLTALLGAEVAPPDGFPIPPSGRELKWFRPKTVAIGTTTFSPKYAATTDLSSRCLAGDAPVLGVLGADFFASFAIEVDNDACEWKVYAPGEHVPRWKQAHSIRVERVFESMPFVEIDIAGEKIKLLVDTGGGMNLRLAPESFARVKPHVGAPVYHPQVYSTVDDEEAGAHLVELHFLKT